MPKRPRAHQIGDVARNAVEKVFNELGWATEVVKQDYGEDLLVQPVFREEVEHFRIWVQVKGTASTRLPRGGVRSVQVSAATALRWARSADPVLFVLWNVTLGAGNAGWTATSVRDWKDFKKPVAIALDGKTFDKTAAMRFGREAFLRHYQRLLIEAAADEKFNVALDLPDDARQAEARHSRFVDELLAELGILRSARGHLSARFRQRVREMEPQTRQRNPDQRVKSACILALLDWVGKEWGIAVPQHLFEACLPSIEVAVYAEDLVKLGLVTRRRFGRYSAVRQTK